MGDLTHFDLKFEFVGGSAFLFWLTAVRYDAIPLPDYYKYREK